MSGSAQQFVEKFVGGLFAVRERDITLTVATLEVLRNDPERVGWLLIVTGATTGRFVFRGEPSAASAILIAGVGGTFAANVREDFTLTTHALNGNVAAGTTTVHVVEIVRVSSPAEERA